MKNLIGGLIGLGLIVLVVYGLGYLRTDRNISRENETVPIKYSDTLDLSNSRFEHKNTSKSSFVGGAWYDRDEDFLVLELSGNYYNFCDVESSIWKGFKRASSYGKYFNQNIKGEYDC